MRFLKRTKYVGAIGILLLLTVLSSAVHIMCYDMILGRLISPVDKLANRLPEFSITNGQLRTSDSSDVFNYKTETWQLVMTMSGDLYRAYIPLDKNYLVITSDKVCFKPLVISPIRDPILMPTRYLDGATKGDLGSKLRDATHRNTVERTICNFAPLFISRMILAVVLAALLRVIRVKHVRRPYIGCQVISCYAQAPSVMIEILMMFVSAVIYNTAQAAPTARPLNVPLYFVMAAMYVVFTAVISHWAHYRIPLAAVTSPQPSA